MEGRLLIGCVGRVKAAGGCTTCSIAAAVMPPVRSEVLAMAHLDGLPEITAALPC
jgi:hypothetical protein